MSNWEGWCIIANRYWVAGTGNWSDNTNHWSASTGGAPNASLPTSADSVYFDANSFTIPDQTVTIDATAYCLDMDWTGATNTPTLDYGTRSIYASGSVTYIAGMTTQSTVDGSLWFTGAANCSMTTNGITIRHRFGVASTYTGTLTLEDTFYQECDALNTAFYWKNGTFDTNNQTMTVGSFRITGALAKTITLGSSIITITGLDYDGSNLTLTANTATINCSGKFAGGGIATYHDVNLNGTAHTVSGDNTFNSLTLKSDATQTITCTAGSIQTLGTATFDGDATHAHTIVSSVSGTLASLIATNVTETYVTYTDMRLSWDTLTVKEVWCYNSMLGVSEVAYIYNQTKGRYA